MNYTNNGDLYGDGELAEVEVKAVKLEPPGFVRGGMQQEECLRIQTATCPQSEAQLRTQESEENRSSNACTGQSSTTMLEQGQSPVDDSGVSSSPICPAPICRQFWKAGNYDDRLGSKFSLQNGKNYLHVHPMFLHSNATSHKWAFGAIAELLDNAVDEIQNGATFVIVDKIINPRDGSPALLIQDDGGGMDPEAMRHCMSFGFSDKKSKSSIGQYGNGFKTSSMRLGADVIVFSRHMEGRTMKQSIGLLSYTFLTRSGHDRIVVPMVDYELNSSTGTLEILHSREHFMSNLSIILLWSPYSTEAVLLKQFDDIGSHGTKIIVYNLWFSEDKSMELDFDSDVEDIRIAGDTKKIQTIHAWKAVNEQHIANQYQYSLRVYLSILYLRIPKTFRMILRGADVEHHNVADDLKYPEYILYKPQSNGCVEGKVITTIGFLKEAPRIIMHGFCVYHKNRLILPFWQVVSYSDSRGRGVVGVLEANEIEPTHNKQDFERTSLFQKLEVRLKEMTWEYWDFHCGLIGYQVKKKPQPTVHQNVPSLSALQNSGPSRSVSSSHILEGEKRSLQNLQGLHSKRKAHGDLEVLNTPKKRTVEIVNLVGPAQSLGSQPLNTTASQFKDQEAANLMQENVKLRAKCLEYEKKGEELNEKVVELRSKLVEVGEEYDRMLAELETLGVIKEEKGVTT